MLEFLFNKVVGLKACSFIKIRLQHRCIPLKFLKISEKIFYGTASVAALYYSASLSPLQEII